MTISFLLNGEQAQVDTVPDRRAVDLLREDLQIRSIRMRCDGRLCGSCLILLDDRPVHSCMLPAFELRYRDVWTMEGLSAADGFEDIVTGFKDARVQLCPACAASRALVTEALLRSTTRPGAEQTREAAESVRCGCSSTRRILDGMLRAARLRERRIHGL